MHLSSPTHLKLSLENSDLTSREIQEQAHTHTIISLIFAGILVTLSTMVSWLGGFPLSITLTYAILGIVLLAAGYTWLTINYTCPPKQAFPTPLSSPQSDISYSEETPPLLLPTLRIPRLSDLNEHHVANTLTTYFHHVSTSPTGKIKPTSQLVVLKNIVTGKLLHFFQGHPADDCSIKVPRSALLLLTNSSKSYGLTIGRTLTVTALIDKSCWNHITGNPNEPFSPGSIALGRWARPQGSPPASHLMIMNPLSLEYLVDLQGERRAITFRDFCHKEAFIHCVNMYQQCFLRCQEEGITALQIECLGLTNLGECQEEYPQWEALCHLALLEAVRLLDPTSSLTCVTVNHQRRLPLLKALQSAFN